MTPEKRTLYTKGQEALEGWAVLLDTLDGMVRQTMERGWTEAQARRIVAYGFGGTPEEDDT